MRHLLLMALATVLVCGGCSDDPTDSVDSGTNDTDTDTDSDTDADTDADSDSDSDADPDTDTDTDTGTDTNCPLGEYSGNFEINTQSDVATLAGYTSVSGGVLTIECPSCTDLSELICLTSVDDLWINSNDTLTNLDGLSGITSLINLRINSNDALANLDGLSGITGWVGGDLDIDGNAALANLDGLSGITFVGWKVGIADNVSLPDCEACDLLDQLTPAPSVIDVHDNLDDSCTPVPASCP